MGQAASPLFVGGKLAEAALLLLPAVQKEHLQDMQQLVCLRTSMVIYQYDHGTSSIERHLIYQISMADLRHMSTAL